MGTMEGIKQRAQFIQDTLDRMDYSPETAKRLLGILRKITEAIKTVNNSGEDAKRFINDVLEAFAELVTDPQNGYIFVAYVFAMTANTFQRIVEWQTQIPEILQPKCNEIREYLEKAKALMAEADQEAKKFEAKLNHVFENGCVITDIEMKQLRWAQIKLRSKLKICGDYLSTCHEVLVLLESDVKRHIVFLGLGTIVSVIITGYAFQKALTAAKCIAELRATPGLSAGSTGGVVKTFLLSGLTISGAFITCKLLAILCEYSQVYLVDIEKMKSELRMMNARLKELQTEEEKLQKGMGQFKYTRPKATF